MIILMLAACSGGSKLPAITGTVTAESGQAGDVRGPVAFGVTTAGKAAVLVAPNPDATCADAAAFITGGDEDFNPETVLGAGVCAVYALIDGYDGAEVTLTEGATLVVDCAMDAGEWVYEERGSGYEGWFYDAEDWWIGAPEAYTLTMSGGDGADLTFQIDMDTYTGRFPYDNEDPEADPATGAVTGGVTATWCDEMAPALN